MRATNSNKYGFFRVGFTCLAIADIMASILLWSVSQTSKSSIDYWLRDSAILISKVGIVLMTFATSIMLAAIRTKQDEVSEIPLPIMILIATPLLLVLLSVSTPDFWLTLLAYGVYAGSLIGETVLSIRIRNAEP